MQLSLDSLKTLGAFTGAPVEKTIKWDMGGKAHEATVYVRPLSYHTMTIDLLARGSGQDGIAGRIASSIVDKEGKPVFSIADITGEADPTRGALDGNLTMALLAVIGEVNGLGKPVVPSKPKRTRLPKPKKPGTS